ncbi:hypothetical protein PsorP6_016212 [Peronosclerospora sorghi]|uniref:Uncharacterized protein n=1 Tax=Peronosclerospora sorghi TaxID=230839 RepID=A0ACC0VRQ1_9STRA|nr:hypothetical protein PsorP6_016212 [Peronosclerospora sorghi]
MKKMASKKLGVRVKRLFLSSGAEISDVDELQNNDTLYSSQGEAFYKSLGLEPDFESLRGQLMMDKDGYVFVYSMDSMISLHGLQPFFDLHLQLNESRRPLPPIILVANKKDVVEREPKKCQVSTEEGRRIAHS